MLSLQLHAIEYPKYPPTIKPQNYKESTDNLRLMYQIQFRKTLLESMQIKTTHRQRL